MTGPEAFGFARGFIDALEDTQADVGYLAGLWKYPALAALRWSRARRKPMVVAPHGMLDPWAVRHSGWKKRIAGALFQNAQLREAVCLRALCAAEAKAFRTYGLKNPVCIIPNGIDLPVAPGQGVARHPHFPAGKKVLLYLGRLHPKKGLARLLEGWADAGLAARGWVLVLAGWDQDGHAAALQRQATALGLAWTDGRRGDAEGASMIFPGPQFGADKEASYASCDAFVLPSLSEGLPMVVLEAWAYGRPVLMTPACNLPEGFQADAAWRIEPDRAGIAAGLRRLGEATPADLRAMGVRGRALAEEQFAWRRLAVRMAAVYEWVLGGGVPPDGVDVGSKR